MFTPELRDYIKKCLDQGQTKEQIKNSLLSHGWPQASVEEGLASADPFLKMPPPPLPLAPQAVFQPEPVMAQKPKKNLFVPILIVVLGFAMLIGGAAFGYFAYFQSPDKIIAKAIDKSAEIKSEEFFGQADINFEYAGDFLNMLNQKAEGLISPFETKVNFNFSIGFNGAADFSEPNQERSFIVFSPMGKTKNQSDAAKAPFATLEMRSVDKTTYLGLTNIADSVLPSLGEFASLKGQWLRIDSEEIKQMAKESGVTEEKFKEFDKNIDAPALTQEKITALNKLAKETKLIKIIAKLPKEKIDSQTTHHYKYEINKQSLQKFILEADKIIGIAADSEQEEMMAKFMASVSGFGGEIWIGKKDLFVHKMTVELEIKESNNASELAGKFFITIAMKNFNQAVAIEAPDNAKSLKEFVAMVATLRPPQDCQKLANEEKDQCYLDSAVFLKSAQDCPKIVSFAKRNDCYYEVAKAATDSLVCQQIKEPKTQGWKDECYRVLAEMKKSPDLCENVLGRDWKNYCYAGASGDSSYCDKVVVVSTRQKCKLNLVNQAGI